jgi:hypothetical protein
VKARCSGEHARQVTALHHGQLAVHIGEADGPLVPRLGEGSVGDFEEELHCPGTESLQSFKRDRAECIPRAVVIGSQCDETASFRAYVFLSSMLLSCERYTASKALVQKTVIQFCYRIFTSLSGI